MQSLPEVQRSECYTDHSPPYGADVSNAWIWHTESHLPIVHVVGATVHRDGLNKNFLLECEVIPFGRYIKMFRTDLLPPSSEYIYIYMYIYIYTLPSRQTCYYCIHIFISARYSFFKSFLICYLKILKIYCPFYRVPVSTVFVTRCLLNSRYRGRDRPVGIVTGFRTGPSRNLVWIPGSRKIFIYSRMYLLQAWGPPSLLFSGYEGVISRA